MLRERGAGNDQEPEKGTEGLLKESPDVSTAAELATKVS